MAERPHILIVESRFYEDIADELVRGASAALETAGASFERIEVPGAFEIPAAIAMAMQASAESSNGRRYDGFVALGCVIRGETSHYDYVAGESARKLMDLASDHALAIGYGILTCENREQAWARAEIGGGNKGNKGDDAARACLAMVAVKQKLAHAAV